MTSDKPTLPPGPQDERAADFAQKLAHLERGARTTSGLFRALAEAWAESEKSK